MGLPFTDEVNRDILRDVLTWENDEELGRIVSALRSHDKRKAFFDTYAEAFVARHLASRGCELRTTPAARAGSRRISGIRKRPGAAP